MKSVFNIHESIVNDYKSYVSSFINIKDDEIRAVVDKNIEEGTLWPDFLIHFNPSYQIAGNVNNLVDSSVLLPEMSGVFSGYELFKHQVDAIRLGTSGEDFVVTSGTGSGKSLTYIGTIFNYLFSLGNKEPGIKAIIVYPMNALINSQTIELTKYKENYEKETGSDFPITFEQYTGQEKQEKRLEIRQNLPDIILTNYMMLELILTRIQEKSIRDSIYKSLKYLVFDELHTYRGRQGSDVALLIRRIKAKAENEVLCIGTSATMVTGGTTPEQKEKVAEVAKTFFGKPFTQSQIINESLSRSLEFNGEIPTQAVIAQSLRTPIDLNADETVLVKHPLAIWLENRIALEDHEGILVRNKPMSINQIINRLVNDSGLEEELCSNQLLNLLQWLSNVNGKLGLDKAYLPFKLHQFISQTGSVYITLDRKEITLEPGIYKGKDESKIPLFPVVFSRVSGHEFICVMKNEESNNFQPREFRENADDNEDLTAGFVITGDDVWDPVTDLESLPDAWLRYLSNGTVTIQKKYKERIPQKIYFNEYGNYSYGDDFPISGWFMPARLLFDPTSGTIYDPKTSEGTKLTKLGSEGRSTSTTITTFTILKHLGENGYKYEDQKVLSFTDNRQDAALQAGHFNDFMKVVQLRSALYHALTNADKTQLDHATLGQAIFDALDIGQKEYASNPSDFPAVIRDNENAMKDYLTYRALYDLRRGWRVILPNLEQCGLLEVHYKFLQENCSIDENWKDVTYFNKMPIEDREHLVFQILDYFRRSYAIYSEEYLTQNQISQRRKVINEKLKLPWKFDDTEKINEPYFLRYETIRSYSRMFTASIGFTSVLGKYLREELKKHGATKLNTEEYNSLIKKLLALLENAGWLKSTPVQNREGADSTIYQLAVDKIIWKLGDGDSIIPDLVKNRSYKLVQQKPNSYFREIYRTDFTTLKKYLGREHTGQINNEDRQEREDQFREGHISSLFCSPTMELGIDISTLNVVHMRNVPPNPSNYAQRSGRAGRSGQAAFIFTYCSNYSPHDRHYFKNSTDMVAGVVVPARIDLSNEELLSTHLNALYLAEVGLSELNHSIADLVDEDNREELPLLDTIVEHLNIGPKQRESIKGDFLNTIEDLEESKLKGTAWFNEEWINHQLDSFKSNLDDSINRWRLLYQAAMDQLTKANRVIESGRYSKSSEEMKGAFRDLHQATRQRDLLQNKTDRWESLSEFYPYRYFASEGFLPGYNFTRLPLRTYIPIGDSGEYISRPRPIAVREFGPRNVVYHNGAKYQIEQLVIQDAENNLKKAKISVNSGYFLGSDEYDTELCPFSGVLLSDVSSKKIFTNLLEMSETKSKVIERISCEEEERLSTGFDIETYFSVPSGMDSIKKAVVKSDEDEFLRLKYIPTANIFHLNTKWRVSKEYGFPIGLTTGRWKRSNQEDSAEEIRRVQLFTTDTADALYIEPIKALALEPEGIITLQYALKRAIENVFQIEPNELGVTSMGDHRYPNIFLYEASEGSLGILSQFVEEKDKFNEVINEAIQLLRYDDSSYEEPASYDDLLSYYNQRDHLIIDRFLIKDALNKLKVCNVELHTNPAYRDYEEHYQKLMRVIDPNSTTENEFLKYLYDNGLRLPDNAQKRVEGIYTQPDFFFEPDIWVYCDGTPHDNPEIQIDDKEKRDAILNRGEQVFVYYYKDRLKDVIAKRPDIFKKVK